MLSIEELEIARAEEFDDLFRGLWIHEHPTPERNQYLVLSLDFSTVTAVGGWEELNRTFLEAVRRGVERFLSVHRERLPELRWVEESLRTAMFAGSLLLALFSVVNATRRQLYVLIDEYDRFSSDLLAGGAEDMYESLFDRTDLVRTFYATLKSGTTSGAVGRIFITGVTPLAERGGYPDTMPILDASVVRGSLSWLGTIGSGGAVEKRRRVFERILTDGDVRSYIHRRFGGTCLSLSEQFISLLYFLGMLTLAELPPDHLHGFRSVRVEIPNRMIHELYGQHLRELLEERAGVVVDSHGLEEALAAMAVRGDIGPFLGLFHARVVKAMGFKELRRSDERELKLKLMMLAFLSMSRIFHPLSEKEFAHGYCDLFLGVSPLVPAARFAWLLELKYLPAAAKAVQIERAFAEAEAQVARYASDERLVPLLTRGHSLRAGSLVFVGAKRVLFRPWEAGAGKASARKARAARGTAGKARAKGKARVAKRKGTG